MPRRESGYWDRLEALAQPLWARWWLNPGDDGVRKLLCEHYLPLAQRTAWAGARRADTRDKVVDQHDLTQELAIALLDMIGKFDPERYPGVPFHKYAAPRLSKRVLDVHRRVDFIGRTGRQNGYTAMVLSIDKPMSRVGTDDQPRTLAMQIPAGVDESQDTTYERHILDQLDTADREFARMRWFEQKSVADIAAVTGMSESWVFFKQRSLLPFVLRAMGCEELIGRKAAKRQPGPQPPMRIAA